MHITTETIVEQKQCSKCKELFNLSNFYLVPKTTRLRSSCKKCYNKSKTIYYYKNKQLNPINFWAKKAVENSKYRSIRKALEHNITEEWLINNLPAVCPVLGIKLSFNGKSYNSPSLDRFDNSKGYTTDNVRIISNRANELKSNATIEELEAIVRYMRNE